MSVVYVMSDLHLGHRNICKYRDGFESPEHMYDVLLENTLKTVTKRDILWLLGDCFFTTESVQWLREVAPKVQHINLVMGNHDSDNKERQDNLRTILKEDLVKNLHGLTKHKQCWFSHAPIHADELRGKWCVHGHTHYHKVNDPRYHNVCVEHTNFAPKNFQEIVKELTHANQH